MNTLIVEGIEDIVFLELFIAHKKIKPYRIIQNGGGKSLGERQINFLKEAIDNGNRGCIVFDMDKETYKCRLDQINERIKDILGNKLNKNDIFLFPNNKDNGELEDLLYKIAIDKHILCCFNTYKECIKSKNEKFFSNISKKSKIYAYYETIGIQGNISKFKILLDDKNKELNNKKIAELRDKVLLDFKQYFDLDSEKLKPLEDFLRS